MKYVFHPHTLLWCLIADVAVPSLQVALQVLYKQVGTLLPNVARSAHFAYGLSGPLRLQPRRRRAPRDWRCGHDLDR